MILARTLAIWLAPAALALAGPQASDPGPSLAIHGPGSEAVVAVERLPRDDLRRLAGVDWDARRWSALFSVAVERAESDRTPILGSYRVVDGVLQFTPRFPFVPGLRYRAVFHPDLLPGRGGAVSSPVALEFALPKPAPAAPTVVRHVYPGRSTLPENLLKFYLHFSAPMNAGDAYDHVHLLDADGREIDGTFLKLDDELWDRDGVRLTLFIDPGRIKRDVGPREGFGPVLEAGKSYTLFIDARWTDADGRPLARAYRKTFRTAAADVTCPDIKAWRIDPPAAGSLAPLVVESPEPLDHALFGRLVRVQGPDGRPVLGRAAVDRDETRWSFTPDRPWSAGTHRLTVDTTLEDLAGNNLRRPFELDVFEQVGRRIEADVLDRPFEVAPGK